MKIKFKKTYRHFKKSTDEVLYLYPQINKGDLKELYYNEDLKEYYINLKVFSENIHQFSNVMKTDLKLDDYEIGDIRMYLYDIIRNFEIEIVNEKQ